MSTLIRDYLDELLNSFGRVTPPIDPTTLKTLYDRKDYARMLGWIKKSLQLDLRVRLRVVESVDPSNPMWIEFPLSMPDYGSPEFRATSVTVNARKDLLETKPFEWVVAGFAHELSHVVLCSIGHKLQHDEKAIDLTAMIRGYQRFVVGAERTTTGIRPESAILAAVMLPFGVLYWPGTTKEHERLGYLTSGEANCAMLHLERLSRP